MQVLDNPFWSSLRSIHADIAVGDDATVRYPAQYAPFLGVADADINADERLEELVAPDESVYLVGIAPRVPQGWALESSQPLAQMICETPLEIPDGPSIETLPPARAGDVLALTALVYPHYFRERTMDMGRYFGIYEDGRLAAMIGERLGTAVTREMSAICTHPDFAGRGYARRLTAMLTNDTLARGSLPFLHVSYSNPRAMALYERIGYRRRRDISFWSLRRQARG